MIWSNSIQPTSYTKKGPGRIHKHGNSKRHKKLYGNWKANDRITKYVK